MKNRKINNNKNFCNNNLLHELLLKKNAKMIINNLKKKCSQFIKIFQFNNKIHKEFFTINFLLLIQIFSKYS